MQPIHTAVAAIAASFVLITTSAPAGAESDGAKLRNRMVKFEPQHGHAVVAPMSPPWCKSADVPTGMRPAGALSRSIGTYDDRTIATVGGYLCVYPDDPAYKEQTAYFVQGYMSLTGLGKKDAIAALSARMNATSWASWQKATCSQYEVSDEDQGAARVFPEAMRSFFGCRRGTPAWDGGAEHHALSYDKFAQWYDLRVAPPSELLRVYNLHACYGPMPGPKNVHSRHFRAYAICHVDRKAMTRAALEAEMSKTKLNAYAKTIARESFARALLVDGVVERALMKKIKKDDVYKALFIDAPTRGWEAWRAAYDRNAQAFEAAYAMESRMFGRSLKAARACGPRERQGLAAYIATLAPKDFEAARRAFADATGKVLLGAVLGCAGAQGDAAQFYALDELYASGQPARGPRRAALLAGVSALGEILQDRSRFAISPNDFDLPGFDPIRTQARELLSRSRGSGTILEPDAAVVKKVVVKGDASLVVFKTVKFKKNVYDCKATNKIWKIEAGEVHYHRRCTLTGTRTVDATALPILIPAYASTGIKRGAYVEFNAGDARMARGQPRSGFPIAVYRSAKKKTLVAAYGYALK